MLTFPKQPHLAEFVFITLRPLSEHAQNKSPRWPVALSLVTMSFQVVTLLIAANERCSIPCSKAVSG